MTYRLFFLALVLFGTGLVGIGHAQAAKVVEPEYLSVFFYLQDDGTLRALERQTPESKIKIKALGYGGGEGYIQITGELSPVRFKSTGRLDFVVLASSQLIDPISLVQFFEFERKKGARRLVFTKVGSMGINSKNTKNQKAVAFNAAKYGQSSFRISPAGALQPGEYCLSTPSTAAAFCFGIDAAQ